MSKQTFMSKRAMLPFSCVPAALEFSQEDLALPDVTSVPLLTSPTRVLGDTWGHATGL